MEAETRRVQRAATRVMSCDASIVAVGWSDLGPAVDRLHELEARWSRFLTSSELSKLNQSAGHPIRLSDETFELLLAMVDGWHATDGCFDPTMAGAMVDLGYGASREQPTHRTRLSEDVAPIGRPNEILVDPGTTTVVLPPGTALDPGGIGKGLAADLIVSELMAAGADGAMVEIGGDLRVSGAAPDGLGWHIAIDDAVEGRRSEPQLVSLSDGGVATSSTRHRRWCADGRSRHHLVDPRTGEVCTSIARSCTVIAGSAAEAEAQSKVPFVLRPDLAISHWDRCGLAARVEIGDGSVLESAAWDRFAISRSAAGHCADQGSS